jgi:hypothetical protein
MQATVGYAAVVIEIAREGCTDRCCSCPRREPEAVERAVVRA